jgi:hypothetical protein
MLQNNEMVMPVAPMYGGGNGGFGGLGGDWGWIILLLLFAGGGWGGFGGFGGMGGLAADGAMLYPWMNQVDVTTSGFQNAATNQAISALQGSVTSGFGDVQTALCGGFAGVNANVSNGFAQAEIGANARQIANMQQAFASQTAITGAISDLAAQQASCCCENRLATCQTQNVIAREAADTRYANATNTRDIIQSQSNGTQAILDKLCQLELDGKNDRINDLERQLTAEQFKASQVAQNAFITQGLNNEVDALYNRLSNCPVPTTPVYGRTPIFTCNNNNGCGCGSF